jgi:lysine-specific demethylase 8
VESKISDSEKASPSMIDALPEVDRVEKPTVERFVKEYLLPQKPVVLTKSFEDWPARSRWDFDYIRSTVGSKELRVEATGTQDKAGYFGRNSTPEKMKLADYVSQVQLSNEIPRVYLGGISVPGELPEIAGDVKIPAYVQGKERPVAYLWLGAGKVNTQLHFDINNNFHALLRGRKKFILFPPDQAKYLYPTTLFSPRRHFSQVRLEAPSDPRFPRLKLAKGFRASLSPGDLLFLPSLWWHEVRTLEPSIAVNYWWGLNEYGDKLAYLYVRELPLLWWRQGRLALRWRLQKLTGR